MTARKLKIFLIMGSGAAPVPNSEIFRDNIYEALISLGHCVHLIQFDKFLANVDSRNLDLRKQLLEDHLLESFYENQPFDYLISFLSDQQVTPRFYKEIKNQVFTINWTCNAHQFEILHKEISPHLDLNTYISLKHKDLYKSVGAKSYWMPMAANESVYRPSNSQDIKISFVGTAYGSRPYYIWRLLQSGVELKLFGPNWEFKNNFKNFLKIYVAPLLYNFSGKEKRLSYLEKILRTNLLQQISSLTLVGGIPSDKEYVDIISRSIVSLNFPESRMNNDYLNPEVLFGCNLRDFEIPLSKSMLLTQHSEELDYFFEEGKEVVSFKNESDMIDKARYYSNNHKASKEIALAGYKRAKREHTWKNRFESLFSEIEK